MSPGKMNANSKKLRNSRLELLLVNRIVTVTRIINALNLKTQTIPPPRKERKGRAAVLQ